MFHVYRRRVQKERMYRSGLYVGGRRVGPELFSKTGHQTLTKNYTQTLFVNNEEEEEEEKKLSIISVL